MHDPYAQHLSIASPPEEIRAFIGRTEQALTSARRARVDTSEGEQRGEEDLAEARALLAAQGNA